MMVGKHKDAANVYLWRIGWAALMSLVFYGFVVLTSLSQNEGTAVMLAGLMVNCMPQCGATELYWCKKCLMLDEMCFSFPAVWTFSPALGLPPHQAPFLQGFSTLQLLGICRHHCLSVLGWHLGLVCEKMKLDWTLSVDLLTIFLIAPSCASWPGFWLGQLASGTDFLLILEGAISIVMEPLSLS